MVPTTDLWPIRPYPPGRTRFPVLIVDEPTEALDAATARAVMADILAATRDTALLVVSHRLADMRGLDVVLTMEHGRLTTRRGTAVARHEA